MMDPEKFLEGLRKDNGSACNQEDAILASQARGAAEGKTKQQDGVESQGWLLATEIDKEYAVRKYQQHKKQPKKA